jgi:hypothetical protein
MDIAVVGRYFFQNRLRHDAGDGYCSTVTRPDVEKSIVNTAGKDNFETGLTAAV